MRRAFGPEFCDHLDALPVRELDEAFRDVRVVRGAAVFHEGVRREVRRLGNARRVRAARERFEIEGCEGLRLVMPWGCSRVLAHALTLRLVRVPCQSGTEAHDGSGRHGGNVAWDAGTGAGTPCVPTVE